MARLIKIANLTGLGLLILLVGACTGQNAQPATLADILPLDASRPTLLFLYTDT